ncbi:MAG: ROK family protein [Chlorobi bacterium]|nr:ROK family protein [Chlorobiota bacterium]
MNTKNDKRIVLTLDAGGTNFVFSAIQGNKEIVEPVAKPSNAHNLELCLSTIESGFNEIIKKLDEKPVAISFAFPGPADYPNGIIGDLGNLPAFRGGIALGPMLEEKFGLPVFINNDGDLFAYGEAIAGLLPFVNSELEKAGSPKRFNNLVGVTLGTGFGAGIVRNGELFIGDNSMAAEVWLLRNKLHPEMNVEESISIRAIQRVYREESGDKSELTPKDIFDIADGKKEGNQDAAKKAFATMGEALGDALSQLVTLIDGIVVVGGGVAGAHPFIFPAMFDEMNGTYKNFNGDTYRRLVQSPFNLEDAQELKQFVKGELKEITVPGSERKVQYDPLARTGVGISRLGASKAISIGAYAFALKALDKS